MTENSTQCQSLRQKAERAVHSRQYFNASLWLTTFFTGGEMEVGEEAEAPGPPAGLAGREVRVVVLCWLFCFPLCSLARRLSVGLTRHHPPPGTLISISSARLWLHPHSSRAIPLPPHLPPANCISTKADSQWVIKLKLNCCFHILSPIGWSLEVCPIPSCRPCAWQQNSELQTSAPVT